MKRATWLPLRVGGRWNAAARAAFAGASGVYAVRDASTRRVLYVGSSHTGRGWKTLTRHFQDASGKFKKRGEWTRASADGLEVATWPTAHGQPACDLEAAKIRTLRPLHNKGPGDGYCAAPDDTDFPFGANAPKGRRANPEGGRAAYARTHWGEQGGADRTIRYPDPLVGPVVELGRLVACTYLTVKGGDDGQRTEYEHHFGKGADDAIAATAKHITRARRLLERAYAGNQAAALELAKLMVDHELDFRPPSPAAPLGSLPTLAWNRDGLLIGGGTFRVTTRGIEG